ncbi:type II toxin-antitoxin system RelE/ParE family toxin (plasmid) [Thermococcus indicus]|uniref:Type II toxin-antitoxin system RelE/ParE family toxin n=1 Tax=Thermococcus indicus TaxID=2586643 RepID=A0A4Y5SQL4_9EURY|nr:type II toxin-antitoxin system RelE/ParE family toxin [Thermococcus indicus]
MVAGVFRVDVDKRVFVEAKRWLKPAHIRKLVEFIEALKIDPNSPVPKGYDVRRVKGMKIKGFPAYALRLGGYRVFYGVDWENKVIYLSKIEPRGRAYKR